MSTISPAFALLNSYDPTNPAASLDSALTSSGLSDTYYQQGVAGTASPAPGTQGPTAAPLATGLPTVSSNSTSPNLYQQSLQSLQQWSAQQLITAALSGGPSSASPTSDSSDLVSTLESWAQQQAAQQQAQQQSALNAAQNAIDAATQPTVDASA